MLLAATMRGPMLPVVPTTSTVDTGCHVVSWRSKQPLGCGDGWGCPDLEGRRVLVRASPVFEDGLQIRIGSVLSDASLRRFGAALAGLRAAHRKARAA